MFVGTCEIEIIIYESNSLKEKRHVVKSIIERIKSRYNVSVSEVGHNELWNRAIVGIAVVSNSKLLCETSIANVMDFLDNDERIEVINHFKEVY